MNPALYPVLRLRHHTARADGWGGSTQLTHTDINYLWQKKIILKWTGRSSRPYRIPSSA